MINSSAFRVEDEKRNKRSQSGEGALGCRDVMSTLVDIAIHVPGDLLCSENGSIIQSSNSEP